MIAALFVEPGGVYSMLEGVDLWPAARDARLYAGPHRVIAHPPCQRWGRYWSGGPSAKIRRKLGDDGGCFASSVASVRQWGGVLEHPEASHAWAAFGIPKPPKSGGWIEAPGGWTCCVEQGHYGHRARKATWLYVVGPKPPALVWGPCAGRVRLDAGFHSKAERDAAAPVIRACERLSARECLATPRPFADLLLSIARAA